jgi:hypothetical protein
MIASWAGIEIEVNPYTYAVAGKYLISVNLFRIYLQRRKRRR